MSSPQNPLARYRSYSYYHVIALCDSSQTAEALAKETSLDVWQHSTPGSTNSDLGPMAPKSIGGAGQYCILINGSTDAAFAITKAEWTTATAASVTKDDKSTSIAIEGSMTISEPKGILFLDRIVRCCIEMGVDSSSAVWVVKTFFVGYTVDDAGNEGTDHITDIAPLMFVAIDVIGSFSEQGGTYDISFVSVAHGQARLPQFSNSGRAANFKAGKTLKDTFSNYQQVIRDNYDFYFNCVKQQATNADPSGELVKSLRYVNYFIEPDEEYSKDIYTVTDQQLQAKPIPECDAPVQPRVDANMSIESGIHHIMSMCPKAKEELSQKGTRYQHQIHTAVESKIIDEKTKEMAYWVIYKVRRVYVPHSLSLEDYAVSSGTELSQVLKDNVINFEYIYTGKNIDILEFDMKMTMGLAYLQGATTTNNYRSAIGEAEQTTIYPDQSFDNMSKRQGETVKNIPVYFGTMIKAPITKNTNDANATVQSAYTLTKHSSLEMIDASMKIVGNIMLLNSVNKNTTPDSVKNGASKSQTGTDAWPDWGTIPSIAHVHIKVPRNNDDTLLFMGNPSSAQSDEGTDYAMDFWFQGYYYVIGIRHVFENGEFYQVLEMLSIPEKGVFGKDTAAADTQKLNENINKCYDHRVPCINSKNKPPVAIPEKRAVPTDFKIADAISGADPTKGASVIDSIPNLGDPSKDETDYLRSQMSTNHDLENIQGYAKAPPEVKAAIDNAARVEGLTPEDKLLMVNMMSQESSFNPRAVPRKKDGSLASSAKGLGQILDGTWKGLGMGNADPFDPNANAIATARNLKRSRNTLHKNLGRNPTDEEMYLAHWRGDQGATNILRRMENGNATATDHEKYNLAVKNLNKRILKKVDHVPHNIQSPVYKDYGKTQYEQINTSGTEKPKTNRDAVGAIKDCNVEDTVKNDPEKKGCSKDTANKPDEKSPAPTSAPAPTTKTTGDVPTFDKNGLTGFK